MSALLRQVVNECREGYVSHQQKLYRVGSKFLNCSEVSSQEATFILLSLHLSRSSRSTIFINTGEPEKRTRILKSREELVNMDPDSTDIMVAGLLEYYTSRPDELEDICLADIAANYNYSMNKSLKNNQWDTHEQTLSTNNDFVGNVLKLLNGKGWVVKRRKTKVIRYRKYQLEKEPKHFYREKVMLYIPWRDENRDILQIDCHQKVV